MPSDEDIGCVSNVAWATRLRSRCSSRAVKSYEVSGLTSKFVENFEKFKAKKFPNEWNATFESSRWRTFLNDGTWQTSSENAWSCQDSSDEEDFENSCKLFLDSFP